MFWLITPPETTEWSIERDDLATRLRQKWPSVEIEYGTDPDEPTEYLLWNLDGGRLFEGSLDRTGTSLYLEAPLADIASFAVWWREQVPAEQPLLICDEAYEVDVLLDGSLTAEELLKSIDPPTE